MKSRDFFLKGTHKQFEYALGKYQDALRAKCEAKNSKPENLIKIDTWYHNVLPKKIKSRGKDAHLTHDEIVQCMKWKLSMGKYNQKLKDLIQMNTPRVVMAETKKAFRALEKRNDLDAAISALSNLKGVGPAFASAVLAAFKPDKVPFMSEESLMSMPDCDEVDYTMKEYKNMVDEMMKCQQRLSNQGGDWTLHKIDMTLFSYFILREHKPDLLKDMPDENVKADSGRKIEEVEEGKNAETDNDVKEADKVHDEQGPTSVDGENNEKPAGAVDGENNSEEPKESIEPEKCKTPTGEKRPLEEEDEIGSDSKRPREEDDDKENGVTNGDSNGMGNGDGVENGDDSKSPHKANLSGQLLVC